MVNVYEHVSLKADVIMNKDCQIYYGASDGEFQYWSNNHKYPYYKRHHEQDTEFSKQNWEGKDKDVSSYRCRSRRRDFLLMKKCIIVRGDHKNLLNKRTKLILQSLHENMRI